MRVLDPLVGLHEEQTENKSIPKCSSLECLNVLKSFVLSDSIHSREPLQHVCVCVTSWITDRKNCVFLLGFQEFRVSSRKSLADRKIYRSIPIFAPRAQALAYSFPDDVSLTKDSEHS